MLNNEYIYISTKLFVLTTAIQNDIIVIVVKAK